LLDIGTKTPPAFRPASLPDVLNPLWDLLESCWALDPASRPTAEDVMHSQRQWHDDYGCKHLEQNSPVQDIADYFVEQPESSNRDTSASSMPKEVFGENIPPSGGHQALRTWLRPNILRRKTAREQNLQNSSPTIAVTGENKSKTSYVL